ncbi:MAG: DUF1700 domain-containing protein [Clostridiales bacterium]|nr:DUF1700 domain-containing protein [Clostridiales bacterium]
MNRAEFLAALRKDLNGLPPEDIEKSAEFYSELMDDHMENGLSEEEAAAALGSVDEIAAQILSETSLPKLIKAKVKPNRALKVWEVILIILGAPLWLPLLLAAMICFFSIYIVLWAVIFSLFAADLSLAACGLTGLVALVQYGVLYGNLAAGVLMVGAGMICVGLAILLFLGLLGVTKAGLRLNRNILLWIKSPFIRKENA